MGAVSVRYVGRWKNPRASFLSPHITCWRAAVRGLSGGGIRLLFAPPAESGAVLEVTLEGKGWSRAAAARVICRWRESGGWLHHCELAEAMSATELEDVRASLLP
jgi:hypothetical protein